MRGGGGGGSVGLLKWLWTRPRAMSCPVVFGRENSSQNGASAELEGRRCSGVAGSREKWQRNDDIGTEKVGHCENFIYHVHVL